MEKIKEYINKEMEVYVPSGASDKKINIKIHDPNEKLKEDFEIWLENLNR